MGIIRNVKISSGNGTVEQGLEGNLEYKQIDLSVKPGLAGKLKNGAFYTLTDGTKTWKAVYSGTDGSLVHFKVAEEH